MALEKTINISGDATISDGHLTAVLPQTATEVVYIRVESVEANKTTAHAKVSFAGSKIRGINEYTFDVSVSDGAPNFIKQAYEHLKTLPEFAGAADV